MAYFGVTPSNVFGQGSKDSFDGDASTTAFTLSRAVLLATDIDVFVGNVRQEPNVAYTVSGTTLTFTGTPASGTANIYAVHKATSVGTTIPPTGRADSLTTLVVSGTSTLTGNITNSGTITSGGTVAVTGNVTATGTVEPAGDTAAGDNAAIGFTAAEGLILTGQGSTNDVTIKNDDDTEVMGVATGATVVDFASGPTVADVAIKVGGKETIWVPAAAMTPTASNGCAVLATVETTSGRPDMNVLDFDKDSDEFAQFAIAFPKSWNAGTVTFQFFWSGIAATTGVAMNLQGVAFADNGSIDTVYGTAIVVQDDAQGAVEELLVSAESAAITIAGSPGANELTYFRIGRDVSDSNDDMAGDCRLHGIKLFFTTSAANDA